MLDLGKPDTVPAPAVLQRRYDVMIFMLNYVVPDYGGFFHEDGGGDGQRPEWKYDFFEGRTLVLSPSLATPLLYAVEHDAADAVDVVSELEGDAFALAEDALDVLRTRAAADEAARSCLAWQDGRWHVLLASRDETWRRLGSELVDGRVAFAILEPALDVPSRRGGDLLVALFEGAAVDDTMLDQLEPLVGAEVISQPGLSARDTARQFLTITGLDRPASWANSP
jgi:hypothetical protein